MKRKVIVIGAGVIGCSIADELSRRGAAVTVIDAAEAGSGTSAATFAWVNSNNKTPVEYADLNLLGLQAHERAARSTTQGGDRWFHQIGTVEVAQTDDEMAAIKLKVEKLLANGYEAQLLTPGEVRSHEPLLEPQRLVGGALYPREGWIDVQTMCLTLLGRAIEAGASFAPYETVTNIQGTGVTTTTMDGSSRHHQADVVILAAGNGSKRILAVGGIDFPVHDPAARGAQAGTQNTGIGIISTTGPVYSGLQHLVRAKGIAMRPARNGGITFADHPTGGKWDLGDPRIWTVPTILLERVRELYPALKHTATESVSLGVRVLPEDGLTIADWVTRDKSIYAVATHSGVTLSAHLAVTVAEEVLTGMRHDSLDTFSLSRFATI